NRSYLNDKKRTSIAMSFFYLCRLYRQNKACFLTLSPRAGVSDHEKRWAYCRKPRQPCKGGLLKRFIIKSGLEYGSFSGWLIQNMYFWTKLAYANSCGRR